MKLPHPLLAAFGLAVAAHAGVVAVWVQLEGIGTGHPAKAQPVLARVQPWLVRPASAWAHASATVTQGMARHAALATALPVPHHQGKTQTTAEPDAPADDAMPPTADTAPQPGPFWPASALDFRAWPLQAPDATLLNGIAWTAEHPVRLRLSITAQGQVVGVMALDVDPLPAEVLSALDAMFKATPFMPARRQGQDVASLQDIEVGP